MLVGERAKRARLYQMCTNSSWCDIYIYHVLNSDTPIEISTNQTTPIVSHFASPLPYASVHDKYDVIGE